MIRIIRWTLLPFSLMYQFVVWVRNLLYDRGIFKSRTFAIPTIVVGNLLIGGAGKSPMTEYLIKLLSPNYRVATLSRGYGRKTRGFREVELLSTATEVGDEPLQFKRKFPNITVAVSEDRCAGVSQLQGGHDLVILDDAYQHRKLKPGFSMLLFDFASLQRPTITLPTGDYRDNFSAIKRADIIVVTKCPEKVKQGEQQAIARKIRQYTNAPLFYTAINYNTPVGVDANILPTELSNMDIVLFCGIAKPQPLLDYLREGNNRVQPIIFSDHHYFSERDYEQITTKFRELPSSNKIILTTEKDFQRTDLRYFEGLPLFYIPIHLQILSPAKEAFDSLLQNYISGSRM